MTTIQDLQKRVEAIEKRNNDVETDKAWETSIVRKMLIMVFTYLAIALYLQFIVKINPWINAIIPALGFVLSTLTLPFFKKMWVQYIYRKSKKR